MQAQRLLTKNPRAELYYDIVELFTGLTLVGFLWTHMIFVSTILLGTEVYDILAAGLDDYYLSYIGIPFIIIVAIMHVLSAGRRIPTRYQEQKVIWRHAKMLKGTDTWVWIFQVITGVSILALGAIHVFVVLAQWPIDAAISTERMTAFWWFYLVLLLLGEYHAGFGIYRQFVKWGWFPRRPLGFVCKVITTIILGLGFAALWVFNALGGAL
ncbi:succinate dehydrogenase [Desulforamulus aquiferis]|uniref:Succinate dehydrogenase n=1 Tax=Desulforamulus aquiferis TaxID=1397668 RepID=A0AAW7ZCH8_9FIRM|nr:succinate dehydrogenase [Desulforamulus aquiferis]MDO7787397.1 succinate dehydrogenase [Desulforamulus aquiferis]